MKNAEKIRALNAPETRANLMAKIREGLFESHSYQNLLPSQKRAIEADLNDASMHLYDTGSLEVVVPHIGDMSPYVDFADLKVRIAHDKGASDLGSRIIWSHVPGKG